jgi:hypothetical protein
MRIVFAGSGRSRADQLLVLLDHFFRRRRRALQQLLDALAVERTDFEAELIRLGYEGKPSDGIEPVGAPPRSISRSNLGSRLCAIRALQSIILIRKLNRRVQTVARALQLNVFKFHDLVVIGRDGEAGRFLRTRTATAGTRSRKRIQLSQWSFSIRTTHECQIG